MCSGTVTLRIKCFPGWRPYPPKGREVCASRRFSASFVSIAVPTREFCIDDFSRIEFVYTALCAEGEGLTSKLVPERVFTSKLNNGKQHTLTSKLVPERGGLASKLKLYIHPYVKTRSCKGGLTSKLVAVSLFTSFELIAHVI